MAKSLKEKWNVSSGRLVLILCTFAIGGSLAGYLTRTILSFTEIDHGVVYWIFYILVLTLIWPECVLITSVFTGQFRFFRDYLRRLFSKLAPRNAVGQGTGQKFRLAIFASGAGSNAANLISSYRNDPDLEIALIVCNKPGAGVTQIAEQQGIPLLMIEKEHFFRGDHYLPQLEKENINWIILAGFLWKVPDELISAFPGKIINIHPALLPDFGGKGMYGMAVHRAVIDQQKQVSGITIHFVDGKYDNGEIIFQAKVSVAPDDIPETLAQKIHQLEYEHFPSVIRRTIIQGPDN